MTTHRTYRADRRGGWIAVAGAVLALLLGTTVQLRAQATLAPQSINSGGDTRSGGFGEFYSTIGEPFATDSISVSDDQSTWTGFWQVVPIVPTTGGVEIEATGLHGTGAGIVAVAPNPFTAEVGISIDVPRTGTIDLAAYDLTGRRVETLLRGRQEKGGLVVRWRPEGLAPGAYFLMLTLNGEQTPVMTVSYYR